jgi:23S rRNA Um-2552 2'-O-methyltransferase (EC 2.1.1.-)
VTKERWLAERRSDPWHRKAKEEGYPSRAAYKLIFIQQKYRVIKGIL